MSRQKLIVAMSGATGSIFCVRLLELLQESDIETHLVISKWAKRTLLYETEYTFEQIQDMATEVYPLHDQGATISSGSFLTSGMVVIPCSMRTLSAIAQGAGDNLIHRSADVILKERRKLVLVARESPLNEIHLENMLKLSRMGAVVMPPMPAFYNRPQNLDDMVNHVVGRILDQFQIHLDVVERWRGMVPVSEDP
ncbi:MAG: UbiX family flavin prenyltransferase [Acidobacteriota bacterium]|nr:UbiX family flavin prenyltransferase [Acidobacteriota bacterium]